ncbi:MAG: hypothetical protein NTZ40_03155 [Cyanobacteria bacterium]|nr:hypothetical protein [Cyanobacteriota bacterium]
MATSSQGLRMAFSNWRHDPSNAHHHPPASVLGDVEIFQAGVGWMMMLDGAFAYFQIRAAPAPNRQLKVYAIPLDKHMAIVAKTDQVFNVVGVVGTHERRYRLDMMNI